MEKPTITPHEAELNRLILLAQSRLHAMGDGGFVQGCSLSLRERARLIQVASLDAMATLQRMREVALAVLNGVPLAGDKEVKCADCRHHVPSLTFADEASCAVHLSLQSMHRLRHCSHFQPLAAKPPAVPADPAA